MYLYLPRCFIEFYFNINILLLYYIVAKVIDDKFKRQVQKQKVKEKVKRKRKKQHMEPFFPFSGLLYNRAGSFGMRTDPLSLVLANIFMFKKR